MLELKVAVVVLLVLVLLWLESVWLGPVLLGGLGYLLYEALEPERLKYGAGWICADKGKPYLERCEESPNGFTNRWECEAGCLEDSERTATYENIKKHILDMGLVLPIPSVFLYNIEHNAWLKREYEEFCAREANYSWFINFFSTDAQLTVMRRMVPFGVTVSCIVSFADSSDPDVLEKKLGTKVQKAKEYIEALAKRDPNTNDFDYGSRFVYVPPELVVARDGGNIQNYIRTPVTAGREVMLVNSTGTFAHSNALAIDHDAKRVLLFEPHVNNPDPSIIALTMSIIEWVKTQPWWTDGWEIGKLDWFMESCPLAMQSTDQLTGGGYCQTWSKFMTLMYLLNLTRHPTYVFGHLIFMQKHTGDLLLKFMFYVRKTYHGVGFNANEVAFQNKNLKDAVALIYEKVEIVKEALTSASVGLAQKHYDVVAVLLTIVQDIEAEMEVLSANPDMKSFDEIVYMQEMLAEISIFIFKGDVEATLTALAKTAREKANDTWFRNRILGKIKDYENRHRAMCTLV